MLGLVLELLESVRELDHLGLRKHALVDHRFHFGRVQHFGLVVLGTVHHDVLAIFGHAHDNAQISRCASFVIKFYNHIWHNRVFYNGYRRSRVEEAGKRYQRAILLCCCRRG